MGNNGEKRRKHKRLTGEDIDMFNERQYDQRFKNEKNICDSHIDGA